MAVRIQVRRDTSLNWTQTNPILAQGEIGFELDSNKMKFGTGQQRWNDIQYFSGSGATINFITNSTTGNETTKAPSVAAMKNYIASQISAIHFPERVVEYITLTSSQIANRAITLSQTPRTSSAVVLDIIHGGPQEYSHDYVVNGVSLTWLGKELDGILAVGDKFRVTYTS
jgi:hypothetical protein